MGLSWVILSWTSLNIILYHLNSQYLKENLTNYVKTGAWLKSVLGRIFSLKSWAFIGSNFLEMSGAGSLIMHKDSQISKIFPKKLKKRNKEWKKWICLCYYFSNGIAKLIFFKNSWSGGCKCSSYCINSKIWDKSGAGLMEVKNFFFRILKEKASLHCVSLTKIHLAYMS